MAIIPALWPSDLHCDGIYTVTDRILVDRTEAFNSKFSLKVRTNLVSTLMSRTRGGRGLEAGQGQLSTRVTFVARYETNSIRDCQYPDALINPEAPNNGFQH